MRKIEVVPHNPEWRSEFAHESKLVIAALGNNLITIHHIGSTSIPGIYAKPIIDMLAEVSNIELVDECNSQMIALGYEVMGEFGIPGRRYFRKDINDVRTHHVHTFQTQSPDIARHLYFRDYMIAHPEYAQQYSELKQKLARQFPEDIEGYMDGKDGFIKDMQTRAQEWKNKSI
ncbi:MAG: GrpB family protein [Scytonematopsis contorta HA4267-MV1]|jgi:GrpB-like predicted nucleotidyltransferase (UPF0157 family)|nr:GrpB family protein [Scytonematopsis contorta HA4267-MV1]